MQDNYDSARDDNLEICVSSSFRIQRGKENINMQISVARLKKFPESVKA